MTPFDRPVSAPPEGLPVAHPERGAALLIILLIGLVVGLSALFSSLGQQQTETSRAAQSSDQMVLAKTALIGYAGSYHEQVNPDRTPGYLPCPDTDNDGIQDTTFGDCPNDTTQTVIGRLPYRTLGLPDLRDHTGECLWYVVSASHKAMNAAPGMNWDLRGKLRIVDKDGRVLADPDDNEGGAVAAIIAPGPPVAGQNRVAGNGRCAGDATNAFANWLEGNAAYASPAAGTIVLRQGDVGSSTHNDRIVWITARELYAPIARRSDLLGRMLADLRTCFNSQFASLPLPALANRLDNGAADPKWQMLAAGIDEVLAATPSPAACSWNGSAFTANLWAGWKDHVRYVACKSGTPCLTVGASACTGALLFAGRNANNAPRTAAEKTVAGYFEGDNLTSLTGIGTTFAGATTYNPGNPAQDLALCLTPSTPPGGAPITLSGPVAIAAKTVADGTLAAVADRTLTLGDPDVDSGDAAVASLFGCAWLGDGQPFGAGLRAYFRYRIVKKGEGFVLAILDADRNPATNMCGAGGRHLGYAGLPDAGVENLRYPKIGLEFDTDSQTGYGGNPNSTNSGKNDPASSHLALVFWGQHAPADAAHGGTTYTYDDNVHGEPTAPQPVAPSTYRNPINPPTTAVAGFDQVDAVRHVRLEIARTYSAPPAAVSTYTIKVWLDLSAVPPADGTGTGFSDTTADYLSPPLISTTFKIEDLDTTEAFRTFRLGFTNGASSSAQEIQITQFEARTR